MTKSEVYTISREELEHMIRREVALRSGFETHISNLFATVSWNYDPNGDLDGVTVTLSEKEST